jgi:hypothetical protein
MTIKGLIKGSSINTIFSAPCRLAAGSRYFSAQQLNYVFDFEEPHLRSLPKLPYIHNITWLAKARRWASTYCTGRAWSPSSFCLDIAGVAIGTSLTSYHVCDSTAIGGKAHVPPTSSLGRFLTIAGIRTWMPKPLSFANITGLWPKGHRIIARPC